MVFYQHRSLCTCENKWSMCKAMGRLRKWLLHIAEAVEVQVHVCAIALHGNKLEITSKVASIEPRDGQPVPITSPVRTFKEQQGNGSSHCHLIKASRAAAAYGSQDRGSSRKELKLGHTTTERTRSKLHPSCPEALRHPAALT